MHQYALGEDPTGSLDGSLVLFYGDEHGKNHMLTYTVQDTPWHYNHTFDNSNAGSGIECTTRRTSIADVWMFDRQHRLTQNSYEFNLRSSSVYPPSRWRSEVVFNGTIQYHTAISAIKYSGPSVPKIISQNSTFVYFVGEEGLVRLNITTDDRSELPSSVKEPQSIQGVEINSADGKITSAEMSTNTQSYNSNVFLQYIDPAKTDLTSVADFW